MSAAREPLPKCPTKDKASYGSYEDAMDHLRSLRKKDGAKSTAVYRCLCGRFHVGHVSAPPLDAKIRKAIGRSNSTARRWKRNGGDA